MSNLISALPDSVQGTAQQVQQAVASIPSPWLWVGAAGAALLLFSGKRKR